MADQLAIVSTQTELDRRLRETDHRDRGDDPTPRELARAVIKSAAWHTLAGCGSRPVRVLDVCAGYGCWASELRRWWEAEAARSPARLRELGIWNLEITGVELAAQRETHLRKWCDRVRIGHWKEQIAGEQFDVAIGNPDFELLVGDVPDESMPPMLLEHARAVLLLHQSNSFQRGMVGAEVWRRYPPAVVWLVPGSVRFRVGINPKTGKPWGSDSRCYQASLWLRGYSGQTVIAGMLAGPPDGGASWRWTVPPGSEDPSADLPAAPGWRP